jgi:molecular chaperone IbpA
MIGVDRMANLIESAMRSEGDTDFPPYDVEKIREDGYRITLAAAGFTPDELEITALPNLLVVTGRKAKAAGEAGRTYLHRGIVGRDFERKFELADHVVVKSAAYDNGLLSIDLVRETPEPVKPRRIEIGAADATSNVRRIHKDPAASRAA